MIFKLISFFLLGAVSFSIAAEYQVKTIIPDLNAASFAIPIDPADVCPTTFAPFTYDSGFPQVIKTPELSYRVAIPTGGDYASLAEISSGQRFVKILTTSVTGVPYPASGALYAGTTQIWVVQPGQYLNVVVRPVTYDMQDGIICSSGVPFTLINKTYAQLLAE